MQQDTRVFYGELLGQGRLARLRPACDQYPAHLVLLVHAEGASPE